MDDGLGPNEGNGAGIVAGDEVIDVVPELVDVGEAGLGERTTLQDREPDLDLVEPGAVGRGEVKANVRVADAPSLALGLMGREIVEDDMDLLARIGGDDAVHEVEELDAPAALVMAGGDLAGEDVESGEQGRGAVALVVVAVAAERSPVGQLEIALGPLQRLDVRLLVDRQHDGVVRRVEVEPDDLGGLGDEIRIVALAPRLARGEIDLVVSQETPDGLVRHIDQLSRQQRRRPASVARRRRLIEQRQDPLACLRRVARPRARPGQVAQPGQPLACKALAPPADPSRPGSKLGSNRAGRPPLSRQQHDPRPLDDPVFSLWRPDDGFKRQPFILRQFDRSRFLDVHPILESRLLFLR